MKAIAAVPTRRDKSGREEGLVHHGDVVADGDTMAVSDLNALRSGDLLRKLNARFRRAVHDALVSASVPPREAEELIDVVFVRWARSRADLPATTPVLASLQQTATSLVRERAARAAAPRPIADYEEPSAVGATCRIRSDDGFYGSGV